MKKYRILHITLLSLIILSSVNAGSITREFEFPQHTIKIDRINDYSVVTLSGCQSYTQQIGKPMIPVASINLLLPPSAEISNIEILDAKATEIKGEFLLYPVQEPRPISYQGQVSFNEPDLATYQSQEQYPNILSEIVMSGCKSGFRIGSFFLYPLQYIPNDKKLILYEYIRVKIEYEENKYPTLSLSQSQIDLFKSDVRNLVINPEDIDVFSPAVRVSEPTNIDYVILTSTTLEPRFTPLVNWLRKSGLWTVTRTTSWVSLNYSGRDLQEKIRNFVRDYFTNYGMKYVLLAGDHSIIPSRQSRAVVGSYTGNIPCDLYYLDLQWSWDGNNNNIFGEVTVDTVDLYYDLYGGRWPVETASEVDSMIRKFFTYVKNPHIGYQKRMLLPAATLWTGYNHVQSQDSIANMSPDGWTDRVIDMASNDAWRWATRDSLNTGFGYTHLVGHGNDYGVYIGGPMYYYTDPQTQTNYDKLTIANSIACYPGNFETNDCLAEKMVLERGSAIATIMNSRYGWGQPPSLGPSERLDIRFFDYFLLKDSISIARCHQASKEAYRSFALSQQVWRWCHYELNLFGEPQMMMWKDNPQTMTASFANPIYVGNQTFTVTVSSGGSPLSSAIVALFKGSEVYTKGVTNVSGQVNLTINPTTTGYMYVTVTAKNRLPYEDSVLVTVASNSDVGVTVLSSPTGTVDMNTVITPSAVVYNYGTGTENYLVRMKIGNFYNQTVSVTNHLPATSVNLTFPNWTATQLGNHLVSCSTELATDINASNNKMSGSVFVAYKDVGVIAIRQPAGNITEGNIITPACSVYNYGNTQISFNVRMKIGGFYNQTVSVSNLNAGAKAYVTFANWTATQLGTHPVSCSTELSGDMNTANDKQTGSVTVNPAPIPAWTQKANMPSQVLRKYVNAGGALIRVGTNVYGFKGNNSNEFYRFNGTSWTLMAPAPATVGEGGALCYDGANTIYATQGNGKNIFWAYSISSNVWTARANIPVTVKGGTALAYYNGKVYLLAGGQKINKPNFFEYNPSTNSWTQRAYAPTPDNVAYADGACLVELSGTIYALKNSANNLFFAYNIVGNSWTQKENLPLTHPYLGVSNRVGDGAAMSSSGTLIYAVKGNSTNEFWKYTAGTPGVWSPQDTVPRLNSNSIIKSGGALAFADGMVYLLKGNNTQEFWQFDPALGLIASISLQTNVSVMANEQTSNNLFVEVVPNPIHKNAIIRYNIPTSGKVSLRLYNAIGVLINTIASDYLQAGSYQATINTSDYAKGIYFLRYEDKATQKELKLIIQ